MTKKIKKSTTPLENSISPGFELRCVLKGHTDNVQSVAWSPNGERLASASRDGTIRLWDGRKEQALQILEGHTGVVHNVNWSPDGESLASASGDGTIRLWDGKTGKGLQTLRGHTDSVYDVNWSPNGERLASASRDGTIRLWDGKTGKELRTLEERTSSVNVVNWSPNGERLASASRDGTIRLWDGKTGKELQILEGHTESIYDVRWLLDGERLASASGDGTIRLWDGKTGKELQILEGHTHAITHISFSRDDSFLASKSFDGTVRIWHTNPWRCIAILDEPIKDYCPPVVAFHPKVPALVTHDADYQLMRIWDLNIDTLLKSSSVPASIYYNSAKIALVGDSGVGKSGLGYRIAEDRFLVTESTHGQQFWVVDNLGKVDNNGLQCEVVLWDFAGQPNFRPIHALFLDDVDLALILFDPSRPDTFTGVEYWLEQLSHKRQMCRTVLVAARSDVSKLTTSAAELEAFCRERNISGGFVITSAKSGEGVATLMDIIRRTIDWNARPTTVTTRTFKRIKDYVLALKADVQRNQMLLSPENLRSQLEATSSDWLFNDAEMMGAVRHLQNHGYVSVIRRSAEVESILLAPDLLINLAASCVLKAQENERGQGSLEEGRALRNEYRFQELEKLAHDEITTLLNAVIELFLSHNICFRESIDSQTFLIFPSLIVERPPRMVEDRELVEDTAYIVTGLIENVYPALVVLLGYSPTFQRVHQWRKLAQYETVRGEICGFKLENDDPVELEFVLYYGKNTPDYVRLRFQGLFEEILYSRDVSIKKYTPLSCPKCHRQQERRTVIRRIQQGEKFLYCENDGKKISLPKPTERVPLSSQDRVVVVRDQALSRLRTRYETSLVRVKGFIRDRAIPSTPTCFISYAWGDPIHEHWILRLADDLRNASVDVVLDQLDNPIIGASISRFVSRIEDCNFVLVIGTPSYRRKYENKISKYGSVVAAEVDVINMRLLGTEEQKSSVLPVLLAGEERIAFPPLMRGRVYGDFRQEENYFSTLFDVVLTLHHISFKDSIVRDLRMVLRENSMDAEIDHARIIPRGWLR